VTIHYGISRAEGNGWWWERITGPTFFSLGQLLRLLPLLAVILPLTSWRWRLRRGPDGEGPGRGFLAVAVLGPVALHLLVAAAFGFQLRDIWGSPMWTFTGVLALAALRTDPRPAALRRARWAWAAVVLFSC